MARNLKSLDTRDAARDFARAVAADLEPVNAMLSAILKEPDDAKMRAKLAGLRDRLPKFARDILKSPAAGESLQVTIAEAMANGAEQGVDAR